MNQSAGLSKPISVAAPGSRTRSIVSGLSSQDYDDDQPSESSWATYTDDLDRQQPNKNDSFNEEEDETDLESARSAKELHDQCRKNMLRNKVIVKMNKRHSLSDVDEELKDTACSPHNSPTVSYMNQLNTMKLKTVSNAQNKRGS